MCMWAWIERSQDGVDTICVRGGRPLVSDRREAIDKPGIERELRADAVARASVIRLAEFSETDTKRLVVPRLRPRPAKVTTGYPPPAHRDEPAWPVDFSAHVLRPRGAVVGVILPTAGTPMQARMARVSVSFARDRAARVKLRGRLRSATRAVVTVLVWMATTA